MPSRIVSLFRNLLRKNTVERALDDEIQSAVELLSEEKVKQGLSPSEARGQALMEMGGVDQVKEEVRDVRRGAASKASPEISVSPSALWPSRRVSPPSWSSRWHWALARTQPSSES